MRNIDIVNDCRFINVSHNIRLSTYSSTNNIQPSNSNVSTNNNFLLPDKAHELSHNFFLSHQYNTCKNYNNKNICINHQNIRGLRHKTDELLISLSPNLPQVLCITEHHLTNAEMDGMFAPPYAPGGKFCRKLYRCGGVCIFIQDNFVFSKINCDKLPKEKDLEMCVIKVHSAITNMVIISIYRSPTGDFKFFLTWKCFLIQYIVILLT
jgi:hypothetical protein